MKEDKIKKGVIKCLLNEAEMCEEYAKIVAPMTPTDGFAFVKLAFYQRAKWEKVEVKKGEVLLNSDVSKAFDPNVSLSDLKYANTDGVLPYVVVLNPGDVKGVKKGQIRAVDQTRVMGNVHTEEFIKFAKAIQSDRTDSVGNPLIEAKKRNIEKETTTLEKNWARYRISIPWVDQKKTNINRFYLFEIPGIQLRGELNLDMLKNLMEDA